MKGLVDFVKSSIGKKLVIAATGFLLYGFLVTHVAGNLLLFKSKAAFNGYGLMLESNPALPLAELALLALFATHIAFAIWVTMDNKKARPQGYEGGKQWAGARTLGSATMPITGVLVLLFLLVHLYDFRLTKGGAPKYVMPATAAASAEAPAPQAAPAAQGEVATDLYHMVEDRFSSIIRVAFYLLGLAGLGLHLSHGLQSVAKTVGVSHPKYYPLIQKAGHGLTAIVILGFASMPIYFFLKGASQ